MFSLFATASLSLFLAASSPNSTPAARNVSCKATLTLSDARELATQTPNARAFVQNMNAVLKTEVAGRTADGGVRVRVLNTANNNEEVGTYTINLRTGHILDDDQEPAEDTQTASVREKLIARHCGSR